MPDDGTETNFARFMIIRLQQAAFDVVAELHDFASSTDEIGAVCNFIGVVRPSNNGHAIQSLTLEHYPAMTEHMLRQIVEDATRRWGVKKVLLIHRIGKMAPGEAIVLVATASQYRAAAFAACQFITDHLKTSAPFWKMEQRLSGETVWVQARDTDLLARNKWYSGC